MSLNKPNNRAFTLLEMLLVIAIIGILASIVIIAINPGKQLANARNAQRVSDLNAIHKATQQYYIDNKEWPTSTLSSELTEICDESGNPSGCIDLSALVPNYLSAIPTDPQTTEGSDYFIALPTSGVPQLAAKNSTEYDQTGVVIGTSTDVVAGLGGEEEDNSATITALKQGLVGYWSFDTATSPVPDDSGNGNTGSITGATHTSSGKVGGGYSFDGNGDEIETSLSPNINPYNTEYTISVWVKSIDKNVLNGVWGTNPGSSQRMYLSTDSLSSDKWMLAAQLQTKLYSINTIEYNTWKYIVVKFDGLGNMEMYVNGVSQGTTPITSYNTTGAFIIGDVGTASVNFYGYIDEVAVWNRALTTDEILELFNSDSGLSLVE